MILHYLAAGGVVAAFALGWMGRDYVADKDKVALLRAQAEYTARNLVRRDLAEQAIAAAGARLQPIMKETQHAVAQDLAVPVSCPASGVLADVVVPGAGDRVRWLRARAASPAAGHEPVSWPGDSLR